MASKDNKTSKTARVMNLLSKKQDPAPAAESAETNATVPPILNSMSPDAEVSVQIKNALEDALEEEMSPQPHPAEDDGFFVGQPQPERGLPMEEPATQEEAVIQEALEEAAAAEEAQAAPPVPEEPSVPEELPVQEDPVQEAAPEAPAAEEPAPPAQAPVEEAAPAVEEAPPAPDADEAAKLEEEIAAHWQEPLAATAIATAPGYINVMQVLVEEKAPKYIKMFGLCQCQRCLEDVKALTLNHLPPKYVVLERGDLVPRLTLYEGKYSSDVTAQLLHACRIVMETPHHNR